MMRPAWPVMIATAGFVALGACTTPDRFGDDPNANTRTGAVIGGLAGALVGSQIDNGDGNQAEGILIGGALGAAVGALIGHDLDRQAAELRRELGDDRIRIRNTGDSLIVTMPQDILFATDRAVLRPDLRSDLAALAGNLQRYPKSAVTVLGHTDDTGTASYNLDLSQRRAAAVTAVLIGAGVSPERLQAVGRGEHEPVATNLTEEGRALNRRVNFVIRPHRA